MVALPLKAKKLIVELRDNLINGEWESHNGRNYHPKREKVLFLKNKGLSLKEISKEAGVEPIRARRILYEDGRVDNTHEAKKLMGGKCVSCGFDAHVVSLQFHHKNRKNKSFTISDNGNLSLERILKEAKKCELFCCNCHILHHAKERARLKNKTTLKVSHAGGKIRESILKLRQKGYVYSDIVATLGCTKSTVSYHLNSKVATDTRKRQNARRDDNITTVKKERGGCCDACGYKELPALHFHHIHPEEKSVPVSRIRGCSYELIKKEAKKCVLLCGNCHMIVHSKESNFQDVSWGK